MTVLTCLDRSVHKLMRLAYGLPDAQLSAGRLVMLAWFETRMRGSLRVLLDVDPLTLPLLISCPVIAGCPAHVSVDP